MEESPVERSGKTDDQRVPCVQHAGMGHVPQLRAFLAQIVLGRVQLGAHFAVSRGDDQWQSRIGEDAEERFLLVQVVAHVAVCHEQIGSAPDDLSDEVAQVPDVFVAGVLQASQCADAQRARRGADLYATCRNLDGRRTARIAALLRRRRSGLLSGRTGRIGGGKGRLLRARRGEDDANREDETTRHARKCTGSGAGPPAPAGELPAINSCAGAACVPCVR